ncbi:MAG TPA: hypothetical protein VMR70_07215 [Flavisolibacter sp.]|nr:hypothetical protein [Flavisolibacter sp.]
MKTLTAFCLSILFATIVQAQERVKTIDDLKYYIGYSASEIVNVAKKKGYVAYSPEDDEKKGSFVYKLFMGEAYDIEIITNGGKVIGATGEDFTREDYVKILAYLKNNNYKKTVSEEQPRAGGERVDIWVSSDGKWKVRVDYIITSKDEPTSITLSTGLKYGFE